MNVNFANVPVNSKFNCNGNEYLKKSTRTARLVSRNPDLRKPVFFFRQNEVVEVPGKKLVQNVITGAMVLESVNTPHHCSVSSETYWCM